MAQLIADRYAGALFDIAVENNSVDSYLSEVELVYNSIADNKEFLTVLNHPQISGDEKLNILLTAFKGKISDDIIGLFSIVFKKNREGLLPEILQCFIERVKAYKGIVTAVVSSAKALSEKQLDRIRESLSKNLNKQVVIEAVVDPQLIGGLKINVCGQLIDNTVKKQLGEMKAQLESTRLA
jgi:F-type H+-transporting ATPase subunit delta